MRGNRYLDAVPNNTDTFLDPKAEEIFNPTDNEWITLHPFLEPYFDHDLLHITALAQALIPDSIQDQLIAQPLRPIMFFYSHDPNIYSGQGLEMIIYDGSGGKIKKLLEHAKKHVEIWGDVADDVVVLYFDPPWLAIDGEVRPEKDTEEWLAGADYI